MFDCEWENERVDRNLMAASGCKFGISYLDDALMQLLPNELMLVGAKTGKGKTELATTLAFQFSDMGKSVAFFALEADKWEIHRRLKYRKLAQMVMERFGSKVTFPRFREWLLMGHQTEWHALEQEVDRELRVQASGLRIVYRGERYLPEMFAKEMAALEHETDVFIVDHLHYFDTTARTETEGLKQAIHAIRNASIYHGKPVILLAHLRKSERTSKKTLPDLEDFHGHSDIVKVATTVLLMSPVPEDKVQGEIGKFPTYFHIAKCRTAAECTPYAAILGFDYRTNSYSAGYYLQKASFLEDPEPIKTFRELPSWAKHAIKPVEAPMQLPEVKNDRRIKD